jgi:hypothetical protein
MALGELNLIEPLIDAMVSLLEQNLNGVIDELNQTVTDGYTIPHVVQFTPFVAPPSALQGGMPAVGLQELPGQFEDDLQYSMDATYEYAVVATIQNADHGTLTMQLRRIGQAIAETVQRDRMLGGTGGSGGVMRSSGGAWSVNFERTEPGPMLGDIDPSTPDAPPRSYLSWTALIFSSRRREV